MMRRGVGLEVGEEAWNDCLAALFEYAQRYLKDLPGAPAHAELPVSELERLESGAFSESGEAFEAVLKKVTESVLTAGFNATSPNFMAYIPGGGLPMSAVADFLAALTNRYSGFYGAAPGAAALENSIIRWLREVMQMPESAWGTLTSGGSVANLTALIVARDTRTPDRWGKSVIYVTSETHHSVEKALRIAGLAQAKLQKVEVDSKFCMSVSALKECLVRDEREGLEPWIVCASVGTTNTGAIDPVEPILRVCREKNLWLHLDAAYGGFFKLAENAPREFSLIGEADSLTLDPHKGLFLPYGTGAVLIRDGQQYRKSFSARASYLEDLQDDGVRSPSDYSIELTRHFRGLRLWLPLKVHGVQAFRAALKEKLAIARAAYEGLLKIPRLELAHEPQLSAMNFRVTGEGDEATRALLQRIHAEKKFYLSATTLNGKFYIRMCILSFRTHSEHIEAVLEFLRREA